MSKYLKNKLALINLASYLLNYIHIQYTKKMFPFYTKQQDSSLHNLYFYLIKITTSNF
jgi:hypothetical protein